MIKSWREMPIGVFLQMHAINNLHVNEDEKTFRITALLAGITYDELQTMPLVDARELIANTSFLYTEPKTHKVERSYKIGKHTYTVMRDLSEMTTAQYINYQSIAGRPIEQILGELMAIVLVPEGKLYEEGYNHQDVVDEITDYFNIEDALSVAGFFTRSFEKSMRRMLRYSDGLMAAARITAKKADREMIKAMQTELRLVTDAIRSAYGFRW